MSESYNIDRVLNVNTIQLEEENIVVHMNQVFTYVRSEGKLETGFLKKKLQLGRQPLGIVDQNSKQVT